MPSLRNRKPKDASSVLPAQSSGAGYGAVVAMNSGANGVGLDTPEAPTEPASPAPAAPMVQATESTLAASLAMASGESNPSPSAADAWVGPDTLIKTLAMTISKTIDNAKRFKGLVGLSILGMGLIAFLAFLGAVAITAKYGGSTLLTGLGIGGGVTGSGIAAVASTNAVKRRKAKKNEKDGANAEAGSG